MDKELIVPVERQIEGFNVNGLPSYKSVRNGYEANVEVGRDLSSGTPVGTFSRISDELDDDLFVGWYDRLRGKVVVDLGAGKDVQGYEVARMVGAKGYVGVEPFFARDLLQRMEDYLGSEPWTLKERAHIPASVVCDDMLRTLKRIPDDSVSLMAGAIDDCILGYSSEERDYVSEVNREITRVLHPSGVFINSSSEFFPDGTLKVEENDLVRDVWKFYK
jgi:hypothetical protein